MFRSSALDKTIDQACSNLLLEPDWTSILLICDLVRQNDTTPKYVVKAVKKKMQSPNPHTAYYGLLVLESIVKNCGSPIHDEIATKENCESFTHLIENTPHENVKAKMLELIQAWAFAFRTLDKYQAVKDTMTILKTKGHKFPELKEADAMFTSDTAPAWHDDKVCHRCRVEFTLTQRKHHCRNCGQIFCGQCSAKTSTLPRFGIEKEVRVCDGCFAEIQKPTGTLKRGDASTDLPAEYLNSSLAQQSQTPTRKTEQELKEEEDLQLALALSQSEAEIKSRKAASSAYGRMGSYRKTGVPESVNNVSPVAPSLRDSSPVSISPSFDDRSTDPELAKYLNRDYWEQRGTSTANNKTDEVNPTAPSPMVTPLQSQLNLNLYANNTTEDTEIENFASNLRGQVEIFVNRMKSNSSRGRNISTDSSVQNLFLNLTTMHSRLLEHIKKADDKRMWYEQLQDKQTQIRDSRAALDVLRQEHQEKLRQQAEEAERQRQVQMAYKLDLMRKKKQEYLQYQRQLALQRIQEQEHEMKLRQDQQKVLYSMGHMQPYGNPQFMPSPVMLGQQGQGQNMQGELPAHMVPPYTNANNFQPIANTFQHSTMPRYPMQSPRHMYPNGGQAPNMQPIQQPQFAGSNGVAGPKGPFVYGQPPSQGPNMMQHGNAGLPTHQPPHDMNAVSNTSNHQPNQYQPSDMAAMQQQQQSMHHQLPPQQNQMPPQPNQMQPQPNQMQPQPNQMQPPSNQMPPQHNQMPPHQNQMPPQQNQMPLQQNQIPTQPMQQPQPIQHQQPSQQQPQQPLKVEKPEVQAAPIVAEAELISFD